MTPVQMLNALFARGWTQERLAKDLETTQATISRWLKGSDPKGKNLTKLHAVALREGILPMPAAPPKAAGRLPAVQWVPLLTWVSAGKLFGSELPPNVRAEKRIAVTDLGRGEWIALRVDGDSMDRIAPPDSVIFVNIADTRLIEDKFYVFGQENGDSTFKRYRGGRNPRLQPFSTNPNHETIPTNDSLRVIGRVKRTMLDL